MICLVYLGKFTRFVKTIGRRWLSWAAWHGFLVTHVDKYLRRSRIAAVESMAFSTCKGEEPTLDGAVTRHGWSVRAVRVSSRQGKGS